MRNINANTIVIKIGTNTLTDERGILDQGTMQLLVDQIAAIKPQKKILIVTSGAIGAGMQELGLESKPKDVIMKQVCAAVGQSILMANYHKCFLKHKIQIGQILLTYDDFHNKKTSHNLGLSLEKMLEMGIIPIVNENDPISIDEIGPSFGDNDNMSALITRKIKADLLIMLTNVAGLFSGNPEVKDTFLIKEVKNINEKIESMSGGVSKLGVGGMKSKVEAAKNVTSGGTTVVIAHGKSDDVLLKIVRGEEVGTIFHPSI